MSSERGDDDPAVGPVADATAAADTSVSFLDLMTGESDLDARGRIVNLPCSWSWSAGKLHEALSNLPENQRAHPGAGTQQISAHQMQRRVFHSLFMIPGGVLWRREWGPDLLAERQLVRRSSVGTIAPGSGSSSSSSSSSSSAKAMQSAKSAGMGGSGVGGGCEAVRKAFAAKRDDGQPYAMIGDRVMHPKRGAGTVIAILPDVDTGFRRTHVQFDMYSDTHHYGDHTIPSMREEMELELEGASVEARAASVRKGQADVRAANARRPNGRDANPHGYAGYAGPLDRASDVPLSALGFPRKTDIFFTSSWVNLSRRGKTKFRWNRVKGASVKQLAAVSKKGGAGTVL